MLQLIVLSESPDRLSCEAVREPCTSEDKQQAVENQEWNSDENLGHNHQVDSSSHHGGLGLPKTGVRGVEEAINDSNSDDPLELRIEHVATRDSEIGHARVEQPD